MIKAVLFDADGVLINSFEANLKFYQDLVVKAGYKRPSRKDYLKLFHLHMKDVIRNLTKSKSDQEIERIWKMGKERKVPFPSHLVGIPEDADKILNKLSQKYMLGIVSSKIRRAMSEIQGLSELAKYFKVTVWYEDTENHKPHPEPLLFALANLKIKPDEAVYIGDGISDVKAAKSAGMKAIAYSKELEGADTTVFSFEELPSAILKL